MTAMINKFPGLAVLAGADPLLLPLLKKGGAGCITATSNLVARDLAYVFRHSRIGRSLSICLRHPDPTDSAAEARAAAVFASLRAAKESIAGHEI